MTAATWYASGTGTTGAHMYGRARTRKSAGDTAVGILYFPGGGGLETSWQAGTATQPDVMNAVLRRLTQDSYSMRFVTMHTDWTYGNDTQTTREFDAWGHASSNYQFSNTKVHLIGASMGTVCALNFAKAHPTNVASISLVLPMVDLDDAQPKVAALAFPTPNDAYGGAVPNDHNPIENLASFTSIVSGGCPISMWGTTDDSVCSYSQAVAFASGTGAVMNSLGTAPPVVGFGIVGHDATNLPVQDVVDFILANDVLASTRRAPMKNLHAAGRIQ